jgi:hypothetical protein
MSNLTLRVNTQQVHELKKKRTKMQFTPLAGTCSLSYDPQSYLPTAH